jgi:hypothetical protein
LFIVLIISAAVIFSLSVITGVALFIILFPLIVFLRSAWHFFSSAAHGVINMSRIMFAPTLLPAQFDTPSGESPILCQLTDLHLTLDEKKPEELQSGATGWPDTQEPHGAEIVARAAAALRYARSLSPVAILVSGDVTDSGDEKEWQQWVNCCRTTGPWTDDPQLIVLPGNHDITFNRPEKPDPSLALLKKRRQLYEKSVMQISGSINFPDLHPFRHGESIGHILCLDSNNYPSRHGISGALGLLGRKQLDDVDLLLNKISRVPSSAQS